MINSNTDSIQQDKFWSPAKSCRLLRRQRLFLRNGTLTELRFQALASNSVYFSLEKFMLFFVKK